MWRTNFDPPKLAQAHIDKIVGQIKYGGPDECWLWRGSVNSHGYGMISIGPQRGNRIFRAHRLALFLATGLWPAVVMHTCDNPPCCNPAHLRPADDNLENIADAKAKGRVQSGRKHWSRRRPDLVARGEHNGGAKITADVVQEIRKLVADGLSQYEAARRFGLHERYVNLIITRRRWAHV